jgi:hypothetical protein
MPPANASILVLEATPLDGANADADAASAANRKNLTMVELMSTLASRKLAGKRAQAKIAKDSLGLEFNFD